MWLCVFCLCRDNLFKSLWISVVSLSLKLKPNAKKTSVQDSCRFSRKQTIDNSATLESKDLDRCDVVGDVTFVPGNCSGNNDSILPMQTHEALRKADYNFTELPNTEFQF